MNKHVRNTFIFVIAVVLSGWIGVLVDKIIGGPTQRETLGMTVWLVLPLITTLLLRIFAKDGWKDAGFKLNLKENVRFYISSICIFPIVMLIVCFIGYVFGWIDISNFKGTEFVKVFAAMFLFNLFKNFFEESVWRGYLTEKLIHFKLKAWQLYLLVGIIWASWHIPYYMIFLPIEDIQQFIDVSRLEFVLISFVVIVVWSFMFTELYLATRSIWPCVLLHAMEDAIVNPLILNGFIHIANGKEILVSPIVGIIPTLLFLLVGCILRNMRKSRKMDASTLMETVLTT